MLAWIHVVLGGLGLAFFIGFLAIALSLQDQEYEDEIAMFAGLFGTLSIAFFLPMFLGGLGLLKRWPWARAIVWMESAMLAFATPVGTALAGVNLWVLLSTRETTTDGGIAKFEAFVHRAVRPLVLALIALATLGVTIGLGYLFRDVIDPPREQILTPMPTFPPPTVSREPAL